MDDPVLRAFQRAAATHQGKQSQADPPHVQRNAWASVQSVAPDTRGTSSAASATQSRRKAYVHHGYRKAKEELLEQRDAEATEERQQMEEDEWQNTHACSEQQRIQQQDGCLDGQGGAQGQQEQMITTSADICAAQQAAMSAWHNAAQISASMYHSGELSSDPATGPEARSAPPQPPPPPQFAVTGFMEAHLPMDLGSGAHRPTFSASAASLHEHMERQANDVGRLGDSQLADLLMSWYNCGFQTGLCHGYAQQATC